MPGEGVSAAEDLGQAVYDRVNAVTERVGNCTVEMANETRRRHGVLEECSESVAIEGELHARSIHRLASVVICSHRIESNRIQSALIDAEHEVVGSHRIADTWRVTKGPKKRDVRITLRMPEDLAVLVQEAADADRRSKSDWIVLQLEAIFAKRARRNPEK